MSGRAFGLVNGTVWLCDPPNREGCGAVPPLWLGVLGPAAMLVGGHLPMLPTMAVAMLRHRDEYTGHAVR